MLFEILFNSYWLSKFLKPDSRTVVLILVIFAVYFGITFSLALHVKNVKMKTGEGYYHKFILAKGYFISMLHKIVNCELLD